MPKRKRYPPRGQALLNKKARDRAHNENLTPRQRERKRRYNRRWSRDNWPRTRLASQRHKLANPTYYADYQRQWREQDRSRAVVYNSQRRALQAAALGDGVTREQWLELIAEYGGRCAYCGRLRKLTLDHVDPLSKGGPHDISNAAPACKTCNSSKGYRPLVVWLARSVA